MSLISKICVMFLGWIVMGLVLYVGSAFVWFIRGFFLDPYKDGFGIEFASDCLDAMYKSVELKYVSKEERREFEESDSKDGIVMRITKWMINGLIWPITVSAVMTGFGGTYRRYKDEYDRGIRVRKERAS